MHADQANTSHTNCSEAAVELSKSGRRPRWPIWAVAALLAAVAAVSFHRAAVPKADFKYFYIDARYVWTHRALNPELSEKDDQTARQLPFYLPVVPLLLSPLAACGPKLAAVLWTIGQVVALGYSIHVLSGWARGAGRVPPHVVNLAACLIALPAIIETAHFNQVSFFVLALVLAGVGALERGTPVRAGVWLALATVLKLQPGIFVIWLALKRQWTALVALVVTAVAVALLPCVLVFGPGTTSDYHCQWMAYNLDARASHTRGDGYLRSHFLDYHNQSLAGVLLRSTWPEHPYRTPFQPTHLQPSLARGITLIISVGLAAVLLWLTRRPWKRARRDDVNRPQIWQLRTEAAVYLLAMLIFAPLLRTYYLVCALPGLVLLTRYALGPPAGLGRRLGQIGVGVWLAGMLAWLSPTARSYGAHLIMAIVLAGILLLLANRSSVYSLRKIRQAL
jgi:hypothetical protein